MIENLSVITVAFTLLSAWNASSAEISTIRYWQAGGVYTECDEQGCSTEVCKKENSDNCRPSTFCQADDLVDIGSPSLYELKVCPTAQSSASSAVAFSFSINNVSSGSEFSFDKDSARDLKITDGSGNIVRVDVVRSSSTSRRTRCSTGAGNGDLSLKQGSTTVTLELGSDGKLKASESVPCFVCHVPADVELD